MGYKAFRTQADIREAFSSASKETNGFANITESVLEKNTQTLLLVRLAAGLSQREFSKAMGLTRSSLAHYELGLQRTMKKESAMKLSAKIAKMNLHFSENVIMENYKLLWHKAAYGQPAEMLRSYGRLAFKTRKPNAFESEIESRIKESGLAYKREGLLNLGGMPFFFDFVLPDTSKPQHIIECKYVKSQSKRSLRIIYYKMAYEIGYKLRLAREQYSGIKTTLILKSDIDCVPERARKILEKETDNFLFNPSESKLKIMFSEIFPKSG